MAEAKAYVDSIAKVPTLFSASINDEELGSSLAASSALLRAFAAEQYQVAITPHVEEALSIEEMASLRATLAAMGVVDIEPIIDKTHMADTIAALHEIAQPESVSIDPKMNEAAYAAVNLQKDLLEHPITFEVTPDLNQSALLGVEAELAVLKAQSNIRATESLLAGAAGGGAAAAAGGAGAGAGGLGSLLTGLGFGTGAFGGRFGFAGFGSIASLAGFGFEHLLTTGLGLAGSAAGGAIGGGLLGLGAAGVGGVGLGTDLAGLGQAAGDIKNVVQAQNALTQAVAVYGPLSTEAAAAQGQLNFAMSGFNPIAKTAVANAAKAVQGFKTMFDQFTGVAEAKGAIIISSLVKTADAFLPTIGKFASANMNIIAQYLAPLEQWMKGPGLAAFTVLENKFHSDLPTAMKAFTNGLELLLRTLALIAPYTGKFIANLARLTSEANGAKWGSYSAEIVKLIGLFRTWSAFIVILVKDIALLFGHSAGLGKGIIQELTGYLNQLHTALKNAGSGSGLSQLFSTHKAEILALITAVIQLGTSFTKAYIAIAPTLVRIATLIIQATNAVIKFVQHIPGGSMALGFTLLAGEDGGARSPLREVG